MEKMSEGVDRGVRGDAGRSGESMHLAAVEAAAKLDTCLLVDVGRVPRLVEGTCLSAVTAPGHRKGGVIGKRRAAWMGRP